MSDNELRIYSTVSKSNKTKSQIKMETDDGYAIVDNLRKSSKISLKGGINFKSIGMIACFTIVAVTAIAGSVMMIIATTKLHSELSSLKEQHKSINVTCQCSTCDYTNNASFQNFNNVVNSNNYSIRSMCSRNNRTNGYRKVAELNTNVTGNTTQCPPGFELVLDPISCRSTTASAGCTSVIYHHNGIAPYSEITGKIIAHQYLNPDAFAPFSLSQGRSASLDGYYVDGVSLTYGNPRKHIWTFTAGIVANNVSCGRCNFFKPWFVENYFSCEINDVCNSNTPYCNDPLWDGKQCIGSAAFYRELPEPTVDGIEMRVCRDQNRNDEDILLTLIELYVL